jgi:prolyl-tRNA editing enzyme YbaK/EbsC (Cys-tRNA(Pro) deacylase)
VFKADGRPVLGVVPGDSKVDLGKLAKTLGADKVELVPFDVAQDFSGYPPGGTPPVHHANISKVVFDSELMRFDTIFGGGGTRDKLIEIRVDDAVRLSQAVVADISRK